MALLDFDSLVHFLMFNIIFALYDIWIALFTFQVIFQAISTKFMKLDNTVMYKKLKKQKDKKQGKKS